MNRLPYVAAAAVVIVWAGSVHAGLGRALFGADLTPGVEALLILPALLVAMALCVFAARRQLGPVAARWRPGTLVAGFERRVDRPVTAQTPAAPVAPLPDHRDDGPVPASPRSAHPERPATRPPRPSLVALGPSADPAYASWLLRWDAGPLGAGAVVLPSAEHVLMGRDPAADLLVHVDQISWHHLELRVHHDAVEVMDLGSTNGTWHVTDDDEVKLDPRNPVVLAAWDRLQIAEPAALTFTLEPLS